MKERLKDIVSTIFVILMGLIMGGLAIASIIEVLGNIILRILS